jgi:hypothetical protein
VNTQNRKIIGRWLSIGIVASALVVGSVVLYRTNYYPRTDDAEIHSSKEEGHRPVALFR